MNPEEVATAPLVASEEVAMVKMPVEFAEAIGIELTNPEGRPVKVLETELMLRFAVFDGRMKDEVELIIAVALTMAVPFVVMFVFVTGSRQELYMLLHMETRDSSPLLRQVSSAVAHLFLHCRVISMMKNGA